LYKALVNKLGLEGGHLLLDDTILEKHTLGLEGICKLLDTKIEMASTPSWTPLLEPCVT
jgi:hypothetical protein